MLKNNASTDCGYCGLCHDTSCIKHPVNEQEELEDDNMDDITETDLAEELIYAYGEFIENCSTEELLTEYNSKLGKNLSAGDVKWLDEADPDKMGL